jgi:hypothetical protein
MKITSETLNSMLKKSQGWDFGDGAGPVDVDKLASLINKHFNPTKKSKKKL